MPKNRRAGRPISVSAVPVGQSTVIVDLAGFFGHFAQVSGAFARWIRVGSCPVGF